MKINKLLITTLLCLGVASAADARQRHHHRRGPAPTTGVTQVTPPQHHTITPSVVSTSAPGAWAYTANLASGAVNHGDDFTIFDFGGLGRTRRAAQNASHPQGLTQKHVPERWLPGGSKVPPGFFLPRSVEFGRSKAISRGRKRAPRSIRPPRDSKNIDALRKT